MADDDQPAKANDEASADLDQIPRLPRGGGFKLSMPQLVKIAFTAALLVMVIMIQRPCADAVSSFVTSFDDPGSAGSGSATHKPGSAAAPAPARAPVEYEPLRPGMTEAEIKAAVDRARAKAAARDPGSSAGSGSSTGIGIGSTGIGIGSTGTAAGSQH